MVKMATVNLYMKIMMITT